MSEHQTTRRSRITITLPASRQSEVPPRMWHLAHSRTEYLHRLAFTMSPRDLVANAYLQGLNDAIDTFDTRRDEPPMMEIPREGWKPA